MEKSQTGLAPSNDTPAENRRKVAAGQGVVMVIGGIAVGAFILYAIIMMYGIFYSQ
ncbi:hypothetical protein [Pararhizobium sp. PWRC1-1]|uniref:hypothetical protein n=1 Tax=Pararhizobium sp. PWRC1-1 TaxID=2804566 RepID=UPI003CE9566E